MEKVPNVSKGEARLQKEFISGRSLGLDDAILYLIRCAVLAANLARAQAKGETARLNAARAIAYAEAAEKLSKKRHKHLRLTQGYRKEIARALDMAWDANRQVRM